jgi:hypothetical protein
MQKLLVLMQNLILDDGYESFKKIVDKIRMFSC